MAPAIPSARRTLEIAASALLVTAALVVVLVLRIGPVVLTLADGIGVHSGDSFGLIAAMGALWLMAGTPARRASGAARVTLSRPPGRPLPRPRVALHH